MLRYSVEIRETRISRKTERRATIVENTKQLMIIVSSFTNNACALTDKGVRFLYFPSPLSRSFSLSFTLLIENLNAGQLFAEVSIVFSSRGAPKTLTRRAHFLVLLLLLPRLVFRESYTQECRGESRRYISCLVTIAGCGQPMFNRHRRKNPFRENPSTLRFLREWHVSISLFFVLPFARLAEERPSI